MLRSVDPGFMRSPARLPVLWIILALMLSGILGVILFQLGHEGLRIGHTRVFAPWFQGVAHLSGTVDLAIDRGVWYQHTFHEPLSSWMRSKLLLSLSEVHGRQRWGQTMDANAQRWPTTWAGVTIARVLGFYVVTVDRPGHRHP